MQTKQQEKSPIKQNILLYLSRKGVSQYEFYKESGVTRGILQQNNGISEDNIARFLAYAPDVCVEWLITGKGNMLLADAPTKDNAPTHEANPHRDASTQATPTHEAKPHRDAIPAIDGTAGDIKPIPLVTEQAAAGFGNQCFAIQADDVKDYYIIPKFRFSHVDFMIEVCGLSMYPHFKSGDVIACTVLHDAKFIQWNRCHVIATRDQGILVKRIMPSEHDDCFRIVSDNKDYPPFDLPKDEITGIALVVGSVSLE